MFSHRTLFQGCFCDCFADCALEELVLVAVLRWIFFADLISGHFVSLRRFTAFAVMFWQLAFGQYCTHKRCVFVDFYMVSSD